ncbi:unnamed protein product [Brachionus calyciflorus]|uniref:Uncharacterized protein n=1 Tax=Brachionus calyciflorus TaxID=104777 RepID=A0A814IWN8_9BILA|nr:unnamed protein product [Brachionus calyciflorus]
MTHITEELAIACLEREKEKEKENEHLNKIVNETLGKTLSKLESRDGWVALDIPKISEEELLKEAEKNGLNDDNQTRMFIKFVTTASNFASAKFKDKLQYVPEIVHKIKDLIVEMKKEIKEFTKIAAEFEELIHLFVKTVMNTKHNLNMIKPNLQDSVLHFKVLEDASKSDILNDEDKKDCTTALTSLCDGINKLQGLLSSNYKINCLLNLKNK